jgi:hypothetical protein
MESSDKYDYPYRHVCLDLIQTIIDRDVDTSCETEFFLPQRHGDHKELSVNTMISLAQILDQYELAPTSYKNYIAPIYIGSGFGKLQLFITLYFDPFCIGIYSNPVNYCAAIKAFSTLHDVVRTYGFAFISSPYDSLRNCLSIII